MTSIDIYLSSIGYTGTETVTWSIHEFDDDATNDLGTLIATLPTPSPLTANAVNEFTAPSGTTLAPDSDYIVSLHSTGDAAEDLSIGATSSNGENGLAGWSIENAFRFRGNLHNLGRSVRLTVKGSAKMATTLSATLGSAEFFVEEHSDYYGDLTYRFELELTEAVRIGYRRTRDNAFEVTNGRMVRAKRIDKEQRLEGGVQRLYSNRWRMEVLPIDDREPVTVRLRGDRPCTELGALCAGSTRLSNSPELTLHYDSLTMNTERWPSVEIENATANENDAGLEFNVRLSEPARQLLAVDFETIAGGTATENTDYWETADRILFKPGESVKSAVVRLIEDTVSDDGETVLARISNYRVALVDRVVEHRDRDRLLRLARREGERATRLGIVVVRGRGTVGRRVVDGDRGVVRARERYHEVERHPRAFLDPRIGHVDGDRSLDRRRLAVRQLAPVAHADGARRVAVGGGRERHRDVVPPVGLDLDPAQVVAPVDPPRLLHGPPADVERIRTLQHGVRHGDRFAEQHLEAEALGARTAVRGGYALEGRRQRVRARRQVRRGRSRDRRRHRARERPRIGRAHRERPVPAVLALEQGCALGRPGDPSRARHRAPSSGQARAQARRALFGIRSQECPRPWWRGRRCASVHAMLSASPEFQPEDTACIAGGMQEVHHGKLVAYPGSGPLPGKPAPRREATPNHGHMQVNDLPSS